MTTEEVWNKKEFEEQIESYFEMYLKHSLDWSNTDFDYYKSKNPMLFDESLKLMTNSVLEIFQEFAEEIYNSIDDFEDEDFDEE